jgi:alpha-1,3-rhamnosyltransferase
MLNANGGSKRMNAEPNSLGAAEPLISVVMTSYNYARYIEEAIQSVCNQSYGNLELVVVDDASTDNTATILQELEKKTSLAMRFYRNEKNCGPNVTQSRAVSLAKGDLIAFLASDDRYVGERFRSQVELFRRDPDLMIIYANGWSFRNAHRVARLHGDVVKSLLSEDAESVLQYLYTHTSPFYLQTALVKKEFLLACGGNDEEILADDWVLNIRFFRALTQAGHFAYVDEDTVEYRLHETNLHRNFARQTALKRQVIEKYTPLNLRREALANIYRKQATNALAQDQFFAGLRCFLLSKAYRLFSRSGCERLSV